MGYRSNFHVTVQGVPFSDLAKAFEALSLYVHEKSESATYSEAKWYEYRDELAALSREFPGSTIICDRLGEQDPPDIDYERIWCRNGRYHSEKLEVTFRSIDLDSVLGVPATPLSELQLAEAAIRDLVRDPEMHRHFAVLAEANPALKRFIP